MNDSKWFSLLLLLIIGSGFLLVASDSEVSTRKQNNCTDLIDPIGSDEEYSPEEWAELDKNLNELRETSDRLEVAIEDFKKKLKDIETARDERDVLVKQNLTLIGVPTVMFVAALCNQSRK